MKFILILFVMFPLVSLQAQACESPTPNQALDFFDGESHWIEVKKNDLNEIENRKTIEVILNFSEFNDSRAFMGGSLVGTLKKVCLTKNPKQLKVTAKNVDLLITQESFGLKIQISIFTYFLRPVSVLGLN